MQERLDRIMAVMDVAFDPLFGEAWNRSQVQDALRTPNTHCLLMNADKRLLDGSGDGPAAGFLLSRAAPGEEEILLLGVRPEFRRGGVGSHLITRFKQHAWARGAERLFLEMRVNNPAEAFYRHHRFNPIGKRPNYYRQNDGTFLDAITFGHDIDAVSASVIVD